jgi:hypothetical protein
MRDVLVKGIPYRPTPVQTGLCPVDTGLLLFTGKRELIPSLLERSC